MKNDFYVVGPDVPWRVRNELRAESAIVATNRYRQYLLSKDAIPFIELAFVEIKCAAEVGRGSAELKFDPACGERLQDILMNYIRGCGYKVSRCDDGYIVKWLD